MVVLLLFDHLAVAAGTKIVESFDKHHKGVHDTASVVDGSCHNTASVQVGEQVSGCLVGT